MSRTTGSSRERLVVAPGDRRAALLDLIRGAHRSIALSLFRCDDEAVLQALVHAAARDVQVRVLMTGRARRSQVALAQIENYLTRQRVSVRRWPDAAKYHAKFAIVDANVAMISTGNYTRKCFTRTADFLLLTTDGAVLPRLSALFSADWAACAGRDAPTLTPAASAPGRLIVGPSCTPRLRLAELVLSARRRVRLLDAKLDDPEMLDLLESARANGITVDIRRETRLGRWRSHGKLLLIDQRVAVIGSMAWSSRSLDERRELSIVIRDRGLVAELDAFWRSLPVRSGLRAGAPLREERCA